MICSVDNIRTRDMLAQQFLKTESISNSDICFLCLYVYSENKDVLILHYSWYGMSDKEHQQTVNHHFIIMLRNMPSL